MSSSIEEKKIERDPPLPLHLESATKGDESQLNNGLKSTQQLDNESDDDETKRNIVKRKKGLLVASLVVLVLVAYKRLKQRRGGYTKNTKPYDFVLWPMSILVGWWKGPEFQRDPRESTMSLLLNAARDGLVQQALVGSTTIFFQTRTKQSASSTSALQTSMKSKDGPPQWQWNRAILPPNNDSVKSGLLEALSAGGCSDIRAIPESIWSKLAAPVLAALPFVYLAFLYRLMKSQFGGDDISSKTSSSGTRKLWGDEESDRTTFADVAGLRSVIEEMRELVSYLANPSLYIAMGARPPRGVLLHGPPGSGKTLLARAVAGEAMCDSFTALPGSAFVEMYVGRGAARVRSLFDKARKDALRRRKLSLATSWWSTVLGVSSKRTVSTLQERPACAILFIDELDAVAKSRSNDAMQGNDEREQTLNQLLTEMDGFDSGSSNDNERGESEDVTLIVIGASNRVDVIDPAVLRRFDRQIYVGYPDAEGRKAILNVHARKIKCDAQIDWNHLAADEYTDNFSGADLRNVVNEAALFAIREKNSVVNLSHLMHAARRIRDMKSRTSRLGKPMPMTLPAFFTSID